MQLTDNLKGGEEKMKRRQDTMLTWRGSATQ